MPECLNDDPWILGNSEIGAAELHALGVMNYRWNIVHQALRNIQCSMEENIQLGVLSAEWIAKIDAMRVDKTLERLKALTDRLPDRHNTRKAQAYLRALLIEIDKARWNRNGLVHYSVDGYYSLDAPKTLVIDIFGDRTPMRADLGSIRKVADEIGQLRWLLGKVRSDLSMFWADMRAVSFEAPIPRQTDAFSREALRRLKALPRIADPTKGSA